MNSEIIELIKERGYDKMRIYDEDYNFIGMESLWEEKEIDGVKYQIPSQVSKLIDNLAMQIREISYTHKDFVIN